MARSYQRSPRTRVRLAPFLFAAGALALATKALAQTDAIPGDEGADAGSTPTPTPEGDDGGAASMPVRPNDEASDSSPSTDDVTEADGGAIPSTSSTESDGGTSATSDANAADAGAAAPVDATLPLTPPLAAPSHGGPPPRDVDDVIVSGTRLSHVAGSAQVVKKEQLERFAYDDPTAILRQVPGVYIRGEDGVGLRPNIGIRGANPDRSKKITLMEDGILFGPAPYSAPAAYYFPLMGRMTQVRVVKGPAAIAYGPQTVGGAIDFLTRPIPTKTSGFADAAIGMYDYRKGHVAFGTGDEHFGFLVEGVRLQNTGFAELPNGADTGSTRNDWMVKGAYVVDPDARTKHRFQLKLSYADEISNETYLGLSDADFRANPYRRYPASALDQMKNHRSGIVLSHEVEGPESSYRVKTTAYRYDYDRTWRKLNRLGAAGAAQVLANPDDPSYAGYYAVITGRIDSGSAADTLYIGPNHRTFVSQGIQSVFSTTKATGPIEHRLEAGVRFHYDSIAREHTEDGFLMSNGTLVPAGEATIVTARNFDSTHALALHATDALTWKKLTVTPGARVELIASHTENHLTNDSRNAFVPAIMPGIGVYQEVVRDLGVLGGVYRGFSPPPPGSDGTVSPEYSVNYEAGARYASRRTRAELIGFYNAYSNLTDICTLSSGCVAANLERQFDAGKARIYGLEAAASHELRVDQFRFPATAAYTFTQGEFLNDFQSQDPIYGNVHEGDAIPYIPKHQFSASLAAEHKLGGVNGMLNYVAKMREQAGSAPIDESVATDEQIWLDVGGYVRPLSWLRIYANARNVLGGAFIAGRRPYGARPNAPRWIQVGLKAEF